MTFRSLSRAAARMKAQRHIDTHFKFRNGGAGWAKTREARIRPASMSCATWKRVKRADTLDNRYWAKFFTMQTA